MNFKHTGTFAIAVFLGLGTIVGAQTAVGYYTRYREQSAASVPTPPTGFQNVYISSSDHKVYRKNSSGTSTEVGGSGGSGTVTSVATGSLLTGGPITTTGTIAVDTPTLYAPAVSLTDLGGRATLQNDTGSYTYGDEILPLKSGLVMTGMRFRFKSIGGPTSVKACLYDLHGATTVECVTVSVNADNAYTATFLSPHTLLAGNLYAVTTWETSGTKALDLTGANLNTLTDGTLPVSKLNNAIYWPGYMRYQSTYAAGDAAPTSGDNADVLGCIDPIFQ